MLGSFVGIVTTGTGCQNPQAGTVVRVCFSRQVDDLKAVALTARRRCRRFGEGGWHAGCSCCVLPITRNEFGDGQVGVCRRLLDSGRAATLDFRVRLGWRKKFYAEESGEVGCAYVNLSRCSVNGKSEAVCRSWGRDPARGIAEIGMELEESSSRPLDGNSQGMVVGRLRGDPPRSRC